MILADLRYFIRWPRWLNQGFWIEAARSVLSDPYSIGRRRRRQPLRKEGVDRLRHRSGGLAAPVVRYEVLEVTLVRDVAEFDQHRRHIRRLQHPKTRRFQRMLVHARRVLHFARQQPRK